MLCFCFPMLSGQFHMNMIRFALFLWLLIPPSLVASAQFKPPALQVEAVKDMALIPAGTSTMGCDDFGFEHGSPAHSVYLDDYFIDKYEVTNQKFEHIIPEHAPRRSSLSDCDDCPVTKVTWYEAADYCYLIGKALPSEAQWEKAAGGESGCGFPWGPQFDLSHPQARGGLKLRDKPSATGAFPPNKYGVFDMAGNVWEWTADWYGAYIDTNETQRNPKGPKSGIMKVRRGGAWSDSIKAMAVAYRDWSYPQSRSLNDVGFRCVINVINSK